MSFNHLDFWGKSGQGRDSHTYHPVAFHCLDVAACGRELLATHPLLRQRLEAVSGLEGDRLVGWVSFLLGFHDLGKLADGFQNLRPDLLQRLQGRTSDAQYPETHDLLGYRLWVERLQEETVGPDEDIHDLVEPWFRAAAGHHGSPPRPKNPGEPLDRQFPPEALSHAREVVGWLAGRFLPNRLPFAVEPYRAQCRRFGRASWLFAGLAVTADWIGSNSLWFPFCEDRLSLDDYWQDKAVPQARDAVERAGFTEIPPSASTGLASLWPDFTQPTPLQSLAESVELADGPQLFIVEEVTGGGKTEAALVLAHRLLERRLASGLYVALPTMATANAMYRRVLKVYEKLFENKGASLVLAHSKRHLMDRLEESPRDEAYAEDEPTASQVASAWLSDSRKKALLAQVGVGTIDQALLGVLPVRHQSLRLWGTAGKILIVDEVHACDAYVGTLLRNLLRFHAAFGGSAILLSATLPTVQRRKLLEAFAAGCGAEPPEETSLSHAYPLTTHWATDRSEPFPTEARAEARRRVEIEPLRSTAEAEARIVETAQAGRCACWVRNTIDDAIETWRELSRRLGPDRVQLFHSRFTVHDRMEIERDVLERFGPESGPDERRGRVLVATQVVEQSLDLDFDYMVTDLAPIDLIVQRAGRLRRHRRTLRGERIPEPDERGPTMLGLLTPEPTADAGADWYEGMFDRGAFVYRDHGRLWLTAYWLEEHEGFRVPENARELIEYVYDDDSKDRMPEALRQRSDKQQGETHAEIALGNINGLSLDEGYCARPGQWPEDAYVPTRLGEPTVTLRLIRKTETGYEPWHANVPHAWEMSQVQVLEFWAEREDEALSNDLIEELKSRMLDEGKFVVLAVIEETLDGWVTATQTPGGATTRWSYDATTGLTRMREDP